MILTTPSPKRKLLSIYRLLWSSADMCCRWHSLISLPAFLHLSSNKHTHYYSSSQLTWLIQLTLKVYDLFDIDNYHSNGAKLLNSSSLIAVLRKIKRSLILQLTLKCFSEKTAGLPKVPSYLQHDDPSMNPNCWSQDSNLAPFLSLVMKNQGVLY